MNWLQTVSSLGELLKTASSLGELLKTASELLTTVSSLSELLKTASSRVKLSRGFHAMLRLCNHVTINKYIKQKIYTKTLIYYGILRVLV